MAKKKKGKKRKARNHKGPKRASQTAAKAPNTNDIVARAEELAATGQGQEAIALLMGVDQQRPGYAQALKALAAMHMKRRNFDEAAAIYRQLAGQRPDDPQTFNALGTALTLADRTEEAGQAMKRAVDLAPDNPLYLANLSKLYMVMGRWHLAVTYQERALSAAPEDERWKYNQALDQCKAMAAESQAQPQHLSVVNADTQPLGWDALAGSAEPDDAMVRPQPPAKTDRPLNILFVQEAPCIRNYKLATALGLRGHKITLAYSQAKLSQMYRGLSDDLYHQCIKLRDHRHLWDLCGDYDLVHCHNEPDVLSVVALGGDVPVVHDTHDLISLRADGDPNLAFFEGLANRAAQGRVYTTPYQLAEAEKLYGVKGPSHVHFNYASAGDLPTRWLPKDSEADGAVHIVYEGGIGTSGHRDFTGLFMNLAEAGVHVHIYPAGYSEQVAAIFKGVDTIHYNQPLSPHKIIEEMTRFDFGIIPFNLELGNRRFLDSTIANKLFEYLAAGLPVFASPLKSYKDYFMDNPVGLTFQFSTDIINNIDRMRDIASQVDFTSQIFTHEGEVEQLEAFYYQVIDRSVAAGERDQPLPELGRESEPPPAEEPESTATIHYSRPFGETLAALDQADAPGRKTAPDSPEPLVQGMNAA